jgi:hypothetical protein
MKKVMLGAIALYAFALPFSAASNAAIIDSFDTPQSVVDDTVGDGGVWGSVNSPGGDIIGGERDVLVDLLTSEFGNDAEFIVRGGSSVGNFNIGSESTARFTLQYDGDDADGPGDPLTPDGLGGLDLGSLGNAFVFDVLAADQPGLRVLATVWSGGSSSTVEITGTFPVGNPGLPGNVAPPVPSPIPFADFAGADFSDVGALEFAVTGNVAFDVTVAQIEVPEEVAPPGEVPEPMTLGLVGVGLISIGMVARRKRA